MAEASTRLVRGDREPAEGERDDNRPTVPWKITNFKRSQRWLRPRLYWLRLWPLLTLGHDGGDAVVSGLRHPLVDEPHGGVLLLEVYGRHVHVVVVARGVQERLPHLQLGADEHIVAVLQDGFGILFLKMEMKKQISGEEGFVLLNELRVE